MATKNVKYFALIGTTLALTSATYLAYFKNHTETAQKHIEVNAATETHEINLQRNPTSKPFELTEEDISQIDAVSQAELKQHHYLDNIYYRERGLISPEERAIYQNYPLNTLQEMGKSGDIHALHELGQRATHEEDFKLAFSYYESAAIYGSTVALGYLGNKYEMANRLYLNKENGKRALIVTISYLKVAERRGDYSNSREINRLPEKYARTYGKIELDKNDYQEIDKMANEIYTDLESRRISLGMAPFNNTAPE